MTEQELNDYLWNEFDSCYPVIDNNHNHIIYWYYDESYCRYKKLCKINNIIPKPPKKICGHKLFAQNMTTRNFLIRYEIWKVFYENYIRSFDHIKIFMNLILVSKDTKLKNYIVSSSRYWYSGAIDEDLTIYTDNITNLI